MSTDATPMARYRDFHPIYNLAKLRETLTKLADLPGDTPLLLALDDGNEPSSYAPATQLQVTWWNGYERCTQEDDDAEESLFFIHPPSIPDGIAGQGTFHAVHTLAHLRDTLSALGNLPGDTQAQMTADNSNDETSFTFAGDLQVAWWDGDVQCEESGKDARKALFVT